MNFRKDARPKRDKRVRRSVFNALMKKDLGSMYAQTITKIRELAKKDKVMAAKIKGMPTPGQVIKQGYRRNRYWYGKLFQKFNKGKAKKLVGLYDHMTNYQKSQYFRGVHGSKRWNKICHRYSVKHSHNQQEFA